MGFNHKKATPRHPKPEGQVEGFNKLVNKTATNANQEGTEVHEATYDMLQAYRDTPHPATKMTPYKLMMNREVRAKIEQFPSDSSPKVRRSDIMTQTTGSESNNTMTIDTGWHNFNLKQDKRLSLNEK